MFCIVLFLNDHHLNMNLFTLKELFICLKTRSPESLCLPEENYKIFQMPTYRIKVLGWCLQGSFAQHPSNKVPWCQRKMKRDVFLKVLAQSTAV